MPTLQASLVVRVVAKPDTADELAGFLTEARALAIEEPGTVVWLALRSDPSTFRIVDAFPTASDRDAHLGGRVAVELLEHADRLLAQPPEVLPADVLAVKVPGHG